LTGGRRNRLLGPVLRLLSFILARFGCIVAFAAILFVVAIALTLLGLVFGFTLADVDLWLEARGGFFNAAGLMLFRIVCGLVLALCVFVALSPFLFRAEENGDGKSSWGCALLAIPVGWFAWTGMVMHY
jgi:hypothetical protein